MTISNRMTGLSLVALMAIASVGLSACGEDTSGTAAGSQNRTITTAFSADPAPPDPDTYYESEGLVITTTAYEGLLRYQPDSPELVGLLAESWKVSPDGLTYTFSLRSGVTFSDGTAFDAAAATASFQRRIDLKGGPSYMLAAVASMKAPDPQTFVVTLSRPVAPFLDYLASPYGPLMTSPTELKANEKDGDHGAAWLATHTAGTGPYVLTDVQPAVKYVMTSNAKYWGSQPYFTTINIDVIPDFATQRLRLEGGELDVVLRGLATRDIQTLAKNPNLQVLNFPALFKNAIWVNPESKALGSTGNRAKFAAAIDRTAMTNDVFADRATVSKTVYPPGMLPDGAAPLDPALDVSGLTSIANASKGVSVVVGYIQDPDLSRQADLVQIQLQQAGFESTTRAYSQAEVFALPTTPDQRPDLLMATMNPDAAAPDTWPQVYWYTNAPVNFLGCSVPEADTVTDEAARQTDKAQVEAMSIRAAELYGASNCWVNVSDVKDTIVARANLTGFQHQLPWVYLTSFATLKPAT